MKVKFVGETFGGGAVGLTNGKIYDCIGVEFDLLRIIDDEVEDYLYSAKAPGPMNSSSTRGEWQIVEDDENGTLAALMQR